MSQNSLVPWFITVGGTVMRMCYEYKRTFNDIEFHRDWRRAYLQARNLSTGEMEKETQSEDHVGFKMY